MEDSYKISPNISIQEQWIKKKLRKSEQLDTCGGVSMPSPTETDSLWLQELKASPGGRHKHTEFVQLLPLR